MQRKPVRNDNVDYLPVVFTKEMKNIPNRYNRDLSIFFVFVLFIETKYLISFLTICD